METSEWLTLDPEENLSGALEELQTKLKKADLPGDPEFFFDSLAEILDLATSSKYYSEALRVIDLIFLPIFLGAWRLSILRTLEIT